MKIFCSIKEINSFLMMIYEQAFFYCAEKICMKIFYSVFMSDFCHRFYEKCIKFKILKALLQFTNCLSILKNHKNKIAPIK